MSDRLVAATEDSPGITNYQSPITDHLPALRRSRRRQNSGRAFPFLEFSIAKCDT